MLQAAQVEEAPNPYPQPTMESRRLDPHSQLIASRAVVVKQLKCLSVGWESPIPKTKYQCSPETIIATMEPPIFALRFVI